MDQTTHDILQLFHALSAVPRISGDEGAVTALISNWLLDLGLTTETDSTRNLRCPLPAAPGYEHFPGVILQAHTDMVCVSRPGSCYRPGQDPIHTVVKDGWLCSDGDSSLGADNGVAVAFMLWLAQQKQLPHGPVLLIFTSCEERGLVGAKALSPKWLEGYRYYINLDAFRGDAAIFASAGGLRQSWSHPIEHAKCTKPFGFHISLSGLTGGHSGFDIHRNRLNAIRALFDLIGHYAGLEVCSFSGGSDYNAIPTSASAVVAVDQPEYFRKYAAGWEALIRRHSTGDPGLMLTLEPCQTPQQRWEWNSFRDISLFCTRLPDGVQGMRTDCPGTVANSGNTAVLELSEHHAIVRHFSRCATRKALVQAAKTTAEAAKHFHFTPVEAAGYSPWEGCADNALTQIAQKVYRSITAGEEMEAVALHVGLESSLILEKNPALTGIALGCNIADAHSVHERVELSSIGRMARLVTGLLNQICKENAT